MTRLIGCGKEDCGICGNLHDTYEKPLRMPISTSTHKKNCDPDTLITMWEALSEWAEHVGVRDYTTETHREPVWSKEGGHLSGWRHGLVLVSNHDYKHKLPPKKLIDMNDDELREACR